MSAQEKKAVVRRYLKALEEIRRTGKTSALDRVISPKIALHISGAPPDLQGLEGMKQMMAMFVTAFPDIKLVPSEMTAEGDRVAYTVAWTGTHKGDLMGIPPTGKKVTVTDVHIERVVRGKIVERWVGFDAMGLMQQLGAIPPLGQGKK